ncbi:ABC transporter permease [Paenibacillus sp. YYML68]|uniref:ABC transporter permease n=1 Tax=Paenibacillus sp. YYML68 TaxID=2909250 RepID=UPI00248F9E4F|nr:ABC transporter permease [Paenibacillus sp. YYML68]
MASMYRLVMNESIKMVKKKRLLVVLLILASIIPMFAYAQMKVAENSLKQFGTTDWRAEQRQKITDYTRRLSSARLPDEWKQRIQVEVKVAQYYLDKDVNPASPNGVTFTVEFVRNAVGLLIPLMIMVIAADIVSGEHTGGTIKLLLTRPVPRWKVLLSKLITLILFASVVVVATALLSYLISGLFFGYGGWSAPRLFGFSVTGTEVDFSKVRVVEQWFYLLLELGLVWFAAVTVALMSLMISVLVRTTAAGMGIMLAVLISGTILTNMVSSWETAKYFFMVNLDLTDYLSGSTPPIKGMDLPFSLSVLSVWVLLSVLVSFTVFTKKDVLN